MRKDTTDVEVDHNIDIQKLIDSLYERGKEEKEVYLIKELEAKSDNMFHAYDTTQMENQIQIIKV